MLNVSKILDVYDDIASLTIVAAIFCVVALIAAIKYAAIVAFVVKFFSLE